MTIRNVVLLTGTLALLLAGCAGADETVDGTAATDAVTQAAEEDEGAPGGESDQQEQPSPDEVADEDHQDGDGAVTDEHDAADDAAPGDGDAGDGHVAAADGDVDRVVQIDMLDIAFSDEEFEFHEGEVVRFEFENVGEAPHEAVIGDIHVQEEHEQQMAEGGGHDAEGDDEGGHHGELSTISLEPGESGSFVHEFDEAGELWMGCHVPGHWGAGMRTHITVTG